MNNTAYYDQRVVAQAESNERSEFIKKTYLHLAGAILLFVVLEYFALRLPFVPEIVGTMVNGYNWLMVLGAYMLVSWIADKWANSATSLGMQYAGLGLYVLAETVIFIPLLYVASAYASPDVIPTAGLITLSLFAGLTLIAFTTKKDFSFLGGILKIGFIVAFGVIIASIIFGFTIGLIFSAIMILLASGAILYNTSQVMHNYNTNQYVAASLSLFAAVALLFWYVLRLLMALSRD